ncbi:MAG: SRPBCC family protein [Thermoleophilia bacterium]|nr:SRPBCC family protein [Thermoleophilia bacterium]
MRLEHAFEVPSSPRQTLELLLDAERVVPCMPGARLVEVVDERTWKAQMAVKLGPVGMNFAVDVRMRERDDDAGTVTLGVSGRDTRGKGGAEGTVLSTLTPADGGGTRVLMDTDLRFSGQAAQLGRPGVVKDVSNKLVGQFAECIRARLSAGDDQEAAAEAVERAGKPISGLSLMLSALLSAIRRAFGRGRGRGREEAT